MHKNWSWREKKGEYLVDLNIGRILLNALVHFTVRKIFPGVQDPN
jgi:hypothetical protein